MTYSQTLTAIGAMLGKRVQVLVGPVDGYSAAGAVGVLEDAGDYSAVWYVGGRGFWFELPEERYVGADVSIEHRLIKVFLTDGIAITVARADEEQNG
jgi:hypothetical protein